MVFCAIFLQCGVEQTHKGRMLLNGCMGETAGAAWLCGRETWRTWAQSFHRARELFIRWGSQVFMTYLN